MKRIRLLGIFFFACCVSVTARAQLFEQTGLRAQQGTNPNVGGAYYNFSSGTGCDIKVSIWGYVRNQGRYNIPCETGLLELIAYAGGPQEGSDLTRVIVVRKGGAEKQTEIKEVKLLDLSKFLEVGVQNVQAFDLFLLPGDLVMIEGEYVVHSDNFLRFMQATVAVASVITAVVAVLSLK